jgi:signal transduction histidine kinase
MLDDIDIKTFEKELTLVDSYTQHLSKTIEDFRGFFKKEKQEKMIAFNEIIESTLDIVRISIENKNIKIDTNFTCNENITTYTNELKQVILNLMKNAEDILLEKEIKNPYIYIETKYDKSTLTLSIKDNAGGIPSDIQDKIFDPYFTTKEKKNGTGLGLYMSKIIVEEHCGGKLYVNNDEYGAVFSIEFILEHSTNE